MGHYASEMMCDDCGRTHCVCAPKPSTSGGRFIVLHDYRVMTKDEALASGMGSLTVMFAASFDDRDEAVAAAKATVEEDLKRAKLRLAYLRAVKVVKPWRAKK